MPFLPMFFRPKGAYFGVQFVTSAVQVGTGATTVADTATTSVLLPKPPCTTCQLVGLNVTILIAAACTGTVTAQVFKRDNSGTPADRTLTATKSLKSDVATTLDKSYAIAITATAPQNVTFQAGDACRVDLAAAAAVTTQPTATITAIWAVVQP